MYRLKFDSDVVSYQLAMSSRQEIHLNVPAANETTTDTCRIKKLFKSCFDIIKQLYLIYHPLFTDRI